MVCYAIQKEAAAELLKRAYSEQAPYYFEHHIDWYVSRQMADIKSYSLPAGKIIIHEGNENSSLVQSLDLRNTPYRRLKKLVKKLIKYESIV